MKRTVNSLLAIVILAFTSSAIIAQPGFNTHKDSRKNIWRSIPQEVKVETHISVFDQYLDLSEDQEVFIRNANQDFSNKAKNLSEQKIARKKKAIRLKELRNEHHKSLHAILTKSQYATFLDKKEAIRYDIRQRLKESTNSGD